MYDKECHTGKMAFFLSDICIGSEMAYIINKKKP